MVLLALDQSSRITGWSVFKDNKLVDYGKFTLDEENVDARLQHFRKKITQLIYDYSPDEVVYEDIQFQTNVANNVQTFKVLAEIYGVLSELLTEMRLPHTSILSTSWKSTLGIKGKARQEQKQNAQKYVLEKYGIKVVQDTVDSICIGEHYLNNQKSAWD